MAQALPDAGVDEALIAYIRAPRIPDEGVKGIEEAVGKWIESRGQVVAPVVIGRCTIPPSG